MFVEAVHKFPCSVDVTLREIEREGVAAMYTNGKMEEKN